MIINAIILNYNNYSDLKECLKSLIGQKLPNNYQLKITIIDNNSADGSTLRIKNEFPNHTYIFNKHNKGFAAGVNQGIKTTFLYSDYFLLINNDAILEKQGIKKLLRAGADLAGPTIFYANKPNIVWQAGGYYSKIRMNVYVPLKNKLYNIQKQNKAVEFLSGCVLLIRKRAIQKIGMFDEKFFFYGEDLDFCLRAKKSNLRIIYSPNTYAWHNIKDINVTRTNPFVLQNLAKSYIMIIRKHFHKLIIYGLIIFYCIYTPFRFLQIVAGRNKIANIISWIKGGNQGLTEKL